MRNFNIMVVSVDLIDSDDTVKSVVVSRKIPITTRKWKWVHRYDRWKFTSWY